MAKDLVFVVAGDPEQLKATAASARQIKSHLARQAWKAFVTPETRRRRGQKKSSAANGSVAIELATSERSDGRPSTKQDDVVVSSDKQLVQPPRIEYCLGGGRCDPFMTYPVRNTPGVPFLVDHCMSSPLICRSVSFGIIMLIVFNSHPRRLDAHGRRHP